MCRPRVLVLVLQGGIIHWPRSSQHAVYWTVKSTLFPCCHCVHHRNKTQLSTGTRKFVVPNRTPQGSPQRLSELREPTLKASGTGLMGSTGSGRQIHVPTRSVSRWQVPSPCQRMWQRTKQHSTHSKVIPGCVPPANRARSPAHLFCRACANQGITFVLQAAADPGPKAFRNHGVGVFFRSKVWEVWPAPPPRPPP